MKTFRFAVLLCACWTASGIARAEDIAPDVAQSLTWLPPQSETLAVARGPLTISKPPQKGAKPKRAMVTEKPNPHFALSNLQIGTVLPNLMGRTIELSLEARGNFRPPAGLGLMPYDGCGIVRLRAVPGETAKSLGAKLARGSKRRAIVAEQDVSIFEEKRVNDLWRVYVAVPRPNLILLATTHAQLEQVLRCMSGKVSGPRAFPADWSGWKLVNTKAPFWAFRRLDLPRIIGVFWPPYQDRQAVAFSVEATGPGASSLLMKYQSPNEAIAKKMFDAIKSEVRTGVTMRKTASDVTEISVSGRNSGMADFYVLGFLGTAIFL